VIGDDDGERSANIDGAAHDHCEAEAEGGELIRC
jgi:hypothetical protein